MKADIAQEDCEIQSKITSFVTDSIDAAAKSGATLTRLMIDSTKPKALYKEYEEDFGKLDK